MRRLGFFLLASGLFWTGCIENDSLATASIAQRNVENLARLSTGMSTQQVFQIMRHPQRNEMFELEDDHYEIWFYVTSMTLMDQKNLTHKNLTPLTFKNGTLLGKGYIEYYKALGKEEAEIESEKKAKSTEDADLEKALNAPQSRTPAKKTDPSAQPQAQPSSSPNKPGQKPASPKPKQSTTPNSGTKPSAPGAPSSPTKPTQPAGTKKTTPAQGAVSMSRSSSSKEPPSSKPASEESKKSNEKQSDPKEKEKGKVPLTEEDQKMIDREQEENFDFW